MHVPKQCNSETKGEVTLLSLSLSLSHPPPLHECRDEETPSGIMLRFNRF